MVASIVIFTVVLAVLLPAVAATRREAALMRSSAALRNHLVAFAAYAGDHRDKWPFLADPAAEKTVLRMDDVVIAVPFFDLFAYWHLALAQLGYVSDFRGRAFHDDPREAGLATSHWYSPTCFSHPDYWAQATRVRGTAQLVSTSHGDVAYPSQKAAIFASGFLFQAPSVRSDAYRPARLFGFADGSAERVSFARLIWGYPGGAGTGTGSVVDSNMPGMSTVLGVRGRDVLGR